MGWLAFFLLLAHQASFSFPVILNTDIGADIDDTWALAQILCTDELALAMVVTEHGDTTGKARLVAKFLEQVGRAEIPIGVGKKTGDEAGPQAAWAEDYDLSKYRGGLREDGIEAMHEVIANATETVTLIATGPGTNIHELLKRYPGVVNKVNVIAMGGSIYSGYEGVPSPDAEYNIRTNVEASRAMLTADWDVTLAPLDVAGTLQITGGDYQDLLESIARADDPSTHIVTVLLANYRRWINEGQFHFVYDSHSSILSDVVPVALAHQPEFLKTEKMKLVVTDTGFTRQDPNGKEVTVALEWINRNRFIEQLIERLSGGVLNPYFPVEDEYADLRAERQQNNQNHTVPSGDQFGLEP